MIRSHDFNSRWWGGPVGIVSDVAAFASASATARRDALAPFDWVELRAELATAPLRTISEAGFFLADTQVPFRVSCSRVPSTPSLQALEVDRASDAPFTIAAQDLSPFEHERYRHLPGMTNERLLQRYATWAQAQLAHAPEWSLRIRSGGVVQGWFLSQLTREGLNLELAMRSASATISGMYLYQRALVEYARLGARVGHARFSVENTGVLNIYSRLGAQFLAPVGTWLWVR